MVSVPQLRASPSRVGIHDGAPIACRSTAAEALSELRAAGLDQVGADDLEPYRVVLSPAEFKRLEHRLAAAVAEHWRNHQGELPFGTDMAAEWTITEEFKLPGRPQLVPGREFSVWGFRGRLVFHRAVTTDSGAMWLEAWDEDDRCRAITPDRVRTIHRTTRPIPDDSLRGMGGRS